MIPGESESCPQLEHIASAFSGPAPAGAPATSLPLTQDLRLRRTGTRLAQRGSTESAWSFARSRSRGARLLHSGDYARREQMSWGRGARCALATTLSPAPRFTEPGTARVGRGATCGAGNGVQTRRNRVRTLAKPHLLNRLSESLSESPRKDIGIVLTFRLDPRSSR